MSTCQSNNETSLSSDAIPLVDISALGKDNDRAARQTAIDLGDAMAEIGFAVIKGHGIAGSIITELRRQTVRFFDQPSDIKRALTVEQENYRGYIPLGFFTPNAAGTDADQYEGYKLHTEISNSEPICRECDLYGPNKWPSQQPELKPAVLAYWRECDRVCSTLLSAIALYLGVEKDFFKRAFEQPLTNMTLLHYPPQQGKNFGIHPHKDTDVLTILAPDPVGGLFVRRRDSTHWIEAHAAADTLIINVGDMLETWSAGRLVSTPHKVVNCSGQERYSFTYFAVPRFDVEVLPLQGEKHFSHKPMHVGEVSREIWQSNWPNVVAINECYDPSIPA